MTVPSRWPWRHPVPLAILALFVVACLVGITWGLPGSESWAADAVSPRAVGLFALAETYWPGHFFRYPPLHVLLLTVLSSPWMGTTVLRVGTDPTVLGAALLQRPIMTGIEGTARLVAVVMGAGIVLHTMAFWSRVAGPRVGNLAGLVVALVAPLVFYAHTGNLEVPYLFWTTWALGEVQRVFAGEAREKRAVVLATLAVLTKDQAAGFFLFVVPWMLLHVARRAPRPSAPRAAGGRAALSALSAGVLVYLLLSGALVNPSGMRQRVAFLLGPASADWSLYPATASGYLGLTKAALLAIPQFTSWPLAALAVLGVGLAITSRPRPAWVPALAALSFTLAFTLGARRTEDRFLLPLAVLLLPYAALPLDALLRRGVGRVLAVLAFVPAFVGVAEVDGSFLRDARFAVEELLASLPPGTVVEVYGGPKFLPRVPPIVHGARVGTDPLEARALIPGLAEIVDPAMDVESRRPRYVVLSTEMSNEGRRVPQAPRFGVHAYQDEASARFFAALLDGTVPYRMVLRARCSLPWGLTCRRIHDSIGGEVWVYERVP